MSDTKHKVGCKMAFGRKDPSCARCMELKLGAAPRSWGPSRAQRDARLCEEIRRHDCKKSGCGPVCAFGEW